VRSSDRLAGTVIIQGARCAENGCGENQ